MRPSKCLIGAETLDFIGHNISKGIIEPNVENISKVCNTPQPTTTKELQAFIGPAGFYRNFIPNFSVVAVILTNLTKGDNPTRSSGKVTRERVYSAKTCCNK